ncbi:GntR family transcriptional regulator [Streptomyces sp. NBRC 110028]|uniref:GntR family transcriptional regulator n=1 Tax=Streptomyces sp. NBRC 110028 TaxID=1621260 RepID=UPI0006E1AD96|nr:GntR family transcriptional regulator [Streptomyces sp. NBRC 110028]
MTADDGATTRLPSLRGRRSLREEIAETLRGAVISGELKPGVVYSAPSLAEHFGVSATPVREAMLDLTKEGLVEIARNKGFRVTHLSAAELDDITHLRALIEIPVIRQITEAGVAPEVITRLRPLAAGIEDAAGRRDFIAHVTIDMEFHLTLLAQAGNSRLVEIVRSLRTSSRLYGLRTLTEGSALFDSSHEHAELLDLIEAGDADGAEALMRRHLGHVRGIWAEKPPAPDAGPAPAPEGPTPRPAGEPPR